MDKNSLDFLKTLLATPSPSGYEQPIQQIVREYAKEFANEISTDLHGNVIACVNPDADLRIMFAGHCDQIGMIVSHIDADGFVYAQTIGGWDPQQLVGQRMTIWTESEPVPAVVSRKPIHLLEPEERKRVVRIEDLWLDVGANSRAEVEKVVRVGDAVTLQLGFEQWINNIVNGPGMDDRAGVWVVMEALRRCASLSLNLSYP